MHDATVSLTLAALMISCIRGQSSDQAALISFKNSVTDDPIGVLKTWTSEVPYCNWTGITCHPKFRGKVQKIVLQNQSLSGTIAPAISQLEHLDYLDLEANNFTGEIPAAIGNCTSLQQLSFSSNALTGVIPDVFHMMSRLVSLAIFNNMLGGSIPPSLQNCTKLQSLALQTNQLTGPIPDIFYNLRNLSILFLFENNLQGSIPPSIWNCSKLIWLELSTNNLSGYLPQEYHALPDIQEISLYTNRIEGKIPSWFANCTSLDILMLSENQFSGEIPADLSRLPKLRYVLLQWNQLSGSIPIGLANTSVLERLVLQNNLLTGTIPEFWFAPNLEYLFLSYNRLSGGIPTSLGNLSNATVISLEKNELTGNIPTTFGSLLLLERLGLGYNKLNGTIPATSLLPCKRLGLLRLDGNKLEGVIPSELGELQSLNYLQLKDNELTGEIPASLGKLSKLQDIDLSGNRLTGNLPTSLAHLGNSLVNGFDVSSNDLQGGIPSWIGSFDKVSTISLDHNNFTGDIPLSIGDCKGLTSLNLSWNSLSGDIPVALAELKSLEVLDLSVNSLTGPIPEGLSSLSMLQVLNLSSNSLEGQIPSGGVFSVVKNVSVSGNPLLCGVLVQRDCHEEVTRKSMHLKWIIPSVLATGVILVAVVFGLKKTLIPHEVAGSHLLPLKVFTHEEILSMTNNLSDSNWIGDGFHSKVFKGDLDGKLVAIKVFKQLKDEDKKVFIDEATTLSRLRHRNLTRVIGHCCENNFMALMLEYMPNGSLTSHLHLGDSMDKSKAGNLDMELKLNIATDIAHGLNYMHHEVDVPVIHCDLKPDNVLLDDDFTAHIADFGISKLVQPGRDEASVSSFKGTIGYSPPEYAISPAVSTRGDVFSFGMLLLVLVIEKSPTNNTFEEGDLRAWVLRNATQLEDQPAMKLSMIQAGLLCTQTDPHRRPTSKEVLAMLLNVRGASPIVLPSLEVLAGTP